MRKMIDMTADMIRACALRCPLKLPGGNGVVRVNAETGDWFAYPAKTEVTKRWRKVCIDFLLSLSAAALKAEQFVQEKAAKKEGCAQ